MSRGKKEREKNEKEFLHSSRSANIQHTCMEFQKERARGWGDLYLQGKLQSIPELMKKCLIFGHPNALQVE